jgi:hypothetical protein
MSSSDWSWTGSAGWVAVTRAASSSPGDTFAVPAAEGVLAHGLIIDPLETGKGQEPAPRAGAGQFESLPGTAGEVLEERTRFE